MGMKYLSWVPPPPVINGGLRLQRKAPDEHFIEWEIALIIVSNRFPLMSQ